jgi:hypothetical protein
MNKVSKVYQDRQYDAAQIAQCDENAKLLYKLKNNNSSSYKGSAFSNYDFSKKKKKKECNTYGLVE